MTITGGRSEVDPGVLRRARAGDQRAFRVLVGHYDGRLRALAHRLLGDAARMDDVLQEAYLKAYRGLPSFRGESSPATWLYRIAYNACLDELRRTPAVTLPVEALDDRPSSEPDFAERDAVRRVLGTALATLPVDQRAAVVLVDGEGLAYDEAAEVLGVAVGTVASRVHRGRAVLRRQLADLGEERR